MKLSTQSVCPQYRPESMCIMQVTTTVHPHTAPLSLTSLLNMVMYIVSWTLVSVQTKCLNLPPLIMASLMTAARCMALLKLYRLAVQLREPRCNGYYSCAYTTNSVVYSILGVHSSHPLLSSPLLSSPLLLPPPPPPPPPPPLVVSDSWEEGGTVS